MQSTRKRGIPQLIGYNAFIELFKKDVPGPTDIVNDIKTSLKRLKEFFYDEDVGEFMEVLIGFRDIPMDGNDLENSIRLYSLCFTAYLRAIKLSSDSEQKKIK